MEAKFYSQIPNKTKQNANNKPTPGKQSRASLGQFHVRITWGDFDLMGLRVA